MNVKKRSKEPSVPAYRKETIRQKIMSILEGRILSTMDISGEAGVSEKDLINLASVLHVMVKQ